MNTHDIDIELPPLPAAEAYLYVNGEHKGVSLNYRSDMELSEGTIRYVLITTEQADKRARAAIEADRKRQGEVVVTKTPEGEIIAVTRQDDEGRILSVIAEAGSKRGGVSNECEPVGEVAGQYMGAYSVGNIFYPKDGPLAAGTKLYTCPKLFEPDRGEPVRGERFIRAWINLEELPGGMMVGPEGRFGPVPASTSCWITTSEKEAARLKADGPVLEIWATPQPAEPVKCLDPSMGEHACSNRAQCWEPCGELGSSIEHAKVAEPVELPSDLRNAVCDLISTWREQQSEYPAEGKLAAAAVRLCANELEDLLARYANQENSNG